MSHGEPEKPKHSLFPDSWVVGPAAAALAKDGDGVLVDERAAADAARTRQAAPTADAASTAEPAANPDALPAPAAGDEVGDDNVVSPAVTPSPRAEQRPGRGAPIAEMAARVARSQAAADDAAPPRAAVPARELTREQEIAELRAENERLRRQIEESRRGRPEPAAAATPIDAAGAALSLPLSDDQRRHQETGAARPAWRQALAVLLFVAVAGALAASWMAAQRLADLDGSLPQRVDVLRAELADGTGSMPQRAIARLIVATDGLAGKVSGLVEQAAGTWRATRAAPADPPPAGASAGPAD
ncbi:MAG: hypothetical protein QNJ91_18215 [Gammaproteobacteria bacterium]|nr:hypothetical protein [Gammaproteobacteria bacterium]